MSVPATIDGFSVVEYGYFTRSLLPKGYVPPSDGRPPLDPVQNLAICKAPGADGFYLLYCTSEWEPVTYSYHDTNEATKGNPAIEFGHHVKQWNAA